MSWNIFDFDSIRSDRTYDLTVGIFYHHHHSWRRRRRRHHLANVRVLSHTSIFSLPPLSLSRPLWYFNCGFVVTTCITGILFWLFGYLSSKSYKPKFKHLNCNPDETEIESRLTLPKPNVIYTDCRFKWASKAIDSPMACMRCTVCFWRLARKRFRREKNTVMRQSSDNMHVIPWADRERMNETRAHERKKNKIRQFNNNGTQHSQ